MSVKILWHFFWIVMSSVWLTACVSIPEHASQLNQHVSTGITRNQLQTEKIIHALADSQRLLLKHEWNRLYSKAEHKYRRKMGLSTTTELEAQQQRDIAKITSEAYAILLQDITDIEQDLLQKTRTNSRLLAEINHNLSRYLHSVEHSQHTAKHLSEHINLIKSFDLDLSRLSSFSQKLTTTLTTEAQ